MNKMGLEVISFTIKEVRDKNEYITNMAEADSLRTPGPRARAVLRYTTSEPGLVPESAARVIKDRSLAAFAAGSCYARTPTYPTGAYWVVILFF